MCKAILSLLRADKPLYVGVGRDVFEFCLAYYVPPWNVCPFLQSDRRCAVLLLKFAQSSPVLQCLEVQVGFKSSYHHIHRTEKPLNTSSL
ncbi:unnamed protein product [Cylicocyclus nassatus]|uniref:Uncharacterized protein n=1 Tax=Cylicocyclus nassatus TaxID=53992 RepID=A0AA36H8V2_CYLNA|nr:unnamed protein product [Cylicocyclus nassatus]